MAKEKLENAVTVEYRTQKGYCQCCMQKLENPITSGVRRFTFTRDNFLEWSEYWDEMAKEGDFQEVVEEFVYETLQFFATNPSETIDIERNEFDKVKQFILSDVVSK